MFDNLLNLVEQFGYWGLLFLMFLENIFPPIPSELIMPLGGFLAAQGKMDPILVVLVGTLGSVLGGLPWYYLGRFFGYDRVMALSERFGFIMTMDPPDVDMAFTWFSRHGRKAVFLGRLIPAIRTLISVPAGMARMGMPLFLTLTTLGSLVWTTVLTAAGYVLENHYDKVEAWVDPVSKIVVYGCIALYVGRMSWRLLRGKRG
ncbi:alkaline phosphatase [Niveispirillum lacus]|uniref:Alkaline phosphatase n=1 Tax=Niveispirillum lacus TaxID=1981099 RepID=A0A255Z272_9PROT|nr:DedA family protein [Niveispirillum lacus]OYQ35576.1 alkaline phosphatase [Niveispirillum lacus]